MELLSRPGFHGWDVREQKSPLPRDTFHHVLPYAGDVIDVLVLYHLELSD